MRSKIGTGRPVALFAAIAWVALAAPLAGQATRYMFTPINVPGSSFTVPFGLNDSGQIVGFYGDAASVLHGFLYNAGTYSTIDVPGAVSTAAWGGISNVGQITGVFELPGSDIVHSFLYDAGTFTTIDVPGAANTEARGLNDAEQVVGEYWPGCGDGCGFLYTGGMFVTFNPPDSNLTIPLDINSPGQIVGQYRTPDDLFHGFLYSGGAFTTIDVPGADSTFAGAIDDAGRIAGLFQSSGLSHGFLYDAGMFTRFNVPGALQTGVLGINDLGQLVGGYSSLSGDLVGPGTLGFLATPVTTPEPSSLVLLASGIGMLLGVGSRRRRRRP